jgi:DNA-directed RNA polymerase specialized sigma24 family protein
MRQDHTGEGGNSAELDLLIQVILHNLRSLSPKGQRALIRFLNFWFGLKAERRAVLAKTVADDLSDGEVAEIAGVSRTTLYDWPGYKRLKKTLKPGSNLRRHAVDDDGDGWDAFGDPDDC